MAGYLHRGFWSCMDTLKEKNMLEELWKSNKAPWRVWDKDEARIGALRASGAR